MSRFRRKLASGCALALALSASAYADQGPLGLKIGVQPWTPATNDDTVHFAVDDAEAISAALNDAWRDHEGELRILIAERLGASDLIAEGVTLYDIDARLSQPVLTFERFEGSGVASDPYRFKLRVDLKEGLTASATTPEAPVIDAGLGSYADPRCSFDLDVSLRLSIAIQNVPGSAVLADATDPDAERIVTVNSFDYDGQNAVCDIGVAITEMVGLKEKIEAMVTAADGPVAGRANSIAKQFLAQALARLNAEIAPHQRSEYDLLSMKAFLVNRNGGQQLVLGFGPRAPLPDPTAGQGVLFGQLRVEGTKAVSCASLNVSAQRRTGPKPMLSANGDLGPAPFEPLNVTLACGAGDIVAPGETVGYRISGLSAAFPNAITYATPHGTCSTQNSSREYELLSLIPENRAPSNGGDAMLPQELVNAHDMMARYDSFRCPDQVAQRFDLETIMAERREWNKGPADLRDLAIAAPQIDQNAVANAPVASGAARSLAMKARAAGQVTMQSGAMQSPQAANPVLTGQQIETAVPH